MNTPGAAATCLRTSGEWSVNPSGLTVEGGEDQLTSVAQTYPGIGIEEAKANAVFIAAAPRMHAALQACILAYEERRDSTATGSLWPDPNHIHNARRAIAKAEGRTL